MNSEVVSSEAVEDAKERAEWVTSINGYGYAGRFEINLWRCDFGFFANAQDYDDSPVFELRSDAEAWMEDIAQANPYDPDLDY